ncbi:FtsQ-type POTRA domain-containing protein [Weissella coleopterorum]|uniref:Cell division protein DivIB n=1 Tax=Weissella coleopterorum TaxID=2714949 RepID=A0A6G8AZY3_9LACO|nr:cell division protein FtsQ/DivIB [Weissella coleopterorum]QIL50540.1 FtsQ-type POTRA domain-containing protein [Weissella coleopterorum]
MTKKNERDELMHGEQSDKSMRKQINQFFAESLGMPIKSAPRTDAISKSQNRSKFNFMERNSIHMILILSIFAVIMLLLLSPLMRFEKIEVIGNQDLSKAEVLAASDINKNIPVWQLLSEQNYFTQHAKNNPQLKNIKINYLNMRIAQIKVEENSKVGLINKNNHNYYILSDGRLIDNQSEDKNPQNLPTYEKFPDYQSVRKVATQFASISTALQHSVSEIIWSPDQEDDEKLTLIMDDGNKVLIKWSDINKKLKYYPGMVAQTDKNGTFNFQVGTYFQQY